MFLSFNIFDIIAFVIIAHILYRKIKELRGDEKPNPKKPQERKTHTPEEIAEILSSAIHQFMMFGNFDVQVMELWKKGSIHLGIAKKFELTEINFEDGERDYVKFPGPKEKKKIQEIFFTEATRTSSRDFVNKYQELFNQVLKYRSEILQYWYDRQADSRSKYGKYDKEDEFKKIKNSLSFGEIEKMLKDADDIANQIKKAERDFWDLHNFLEIYMFKVLGHIGPKPSHRPYLFLEPSTDF